MFRLKLFDKTLIEFEIIDDPLDGQSCRIITVDSETENLMPIGLKLTEAGLMKWLKGRVIPKNREFVDAFLARNGLSHNDTRGIIEVCRGLSLNDCYWVTEDGFDGTFAEYNLYEHDFVKALSLIAYTGYGSSKAKGFSSSPEFTTAGMLRKGWRRINGKIYLYKGGTSGAANAGNEPYSEYMASQIAETMGIDHVTYNLAKWKGSLCSTCELFTDIDHSFVPMYRFLDEPSLRNVSVLLKSLGEDYYNAYADMLIFDALIYNEDRHFGNFGLLVDSKDNKPCGFAPLFDHGLSLFNYAMPEDINNLEEYAKTRLSSSGAAFEAIAGEFISHRQKEQLRRLIGFRFRRHSSYNLPAVRIKAIEKMLQRRVTQLLEIYH